MKIQHQVSLAPYNTFGVNQYAAQFAIIQSESDLLNILDKTHEFKILGGGSNVLLTRDIQGWVIKNELKGIQVLEETDEFVLVKVASGENWHHLVTRMVAQNWGGLENLSLIPGTVGAAPIQNIGAYGVEIKDVLKSVEAIHCVNGSKVIFENADCKFGYRESVFKWSENKELYVISSVNLQLTKNHIIHSSYGEIEKKLAEKKITHPTIQDMHACIIDIRQHKLPDPADIGNAGSFFKNPVISRTAYEALLSIKPSTPSYKVAEDTFKIPAGWLIDQAGWKGRRKGQVGCYEKQALVLVNHGGATGDDIWTFAQSVQQDVLDKFNILLEPEINIW